MADELTGRVIAILATDGVEQVELDWPREAMAQAGAATQLISPHSGWIQSMRRDIEPGERYPVDRTLDEVSIDDYDALILPGGTINPDRLRTSPEAVALVREFVTTGRPVAAICHGPWTLAEADVVRGRRLTAYPSIRTDLRNAGAQVVDDEVVVDGTLVTSRKPDDLPAFCATAVSVIAQASKQRA